MGILKRWANEEFVRVYLTNVEGVNRRGRPLGRWENRMKEYVSEGQEGSAWIARGGYPSAMAIPFGGRLLGK